MSDIVGFLGLAAGLLGLLTGFMLLMQRMQNRKLEMFKSMQLHDRLEQLRSAMALQKVQGAILQDISEELVRFTSEARTPEDAQAFLQDLLYLTAEGLLPQGENVRSRLLILSDGRLRTQATWVPNGVPQFRGSTFAAGEGTPGLALVSRDVVMVKNFEEEIGLLGENKLPFKSVLCVPVPATGREGIPAIGVLNLDSPMEDYFDPDSIRFANTVSNIVFLVWKHVYGTID